MLGFIAFSPTALQHQARRGCPCRNDGLHRIILLNKRKMIYEGPGLLKKARINAGFSLFKKIGI
jgi:hypothetical protein